MQRDPLAEVPLPRHPSNVWSATTAHSGLAEHLLDLPPRVYVPNELGGDVAVIDPLSFRIIDRYRVGRTPHHVTPSYDMTRLYVNVMDASQLVEIDIVTGRPSRAINLPVPYNLYFSPDGSKAIVAAEYYNRLDFYDPVTWRSLARVPLRASGIDHMDFTADGRFLLVSGEFDGQVVKVDVEAMAPVAYLRLGGLPIDIKLAADGDVFYVANQGRHGVSLVDHESMREVEFLRTGPGAHGMAVSRDTQYLYLSNRLGGTISVIEFSSRRIVDQWRTGGSPDMLQVSPDGTQLWVSGRWHAGVDVIDTTSGALLQRIRTGPGAHGLTYFPQPGRYSLGHNGVFR